MCEPSRASHTPHPTHLGDTAFAAWKVSRPLYDVLGMGTWARVVPSISLDVSEGVEVRGLEQMFDFPEGVHSCAVLHMWAIAP
jgi:hypothetical protein